MRTNPGETGGTNNPEPEQNTPRTRTWTHTSPLRQCHRARSPDKKGLNCDVTDAVKLCACALISPVWLQVNNAHHDDLLPRPHSAADAPAERHRLHKHARRSARERAPEGAGGSIPTSRRESSSLSGEMRPPLPSGSWASSSSARVSSSCAGNTAGSAGLEPPWMRGSSPAAPHPRREPAGRSPPPRGPRTLTAPSFSAACTAILNRDACGTGSRGVWGSGGRRTLLFLLRSCPDRALDPPAPPRPERQPQMGGCLLTSALRSEA